VIAWPQPTTAGVAVISAGPKHSSAGPRPNARNEKPPVESAARTSLRVDRSTSRQYVVDSCRAPSSENETTGRPKRARCTDETAPSPERSSTDSHPQ